MCVHAHNSEHALANFVHWHAQNHNMCVRAQIGSARGRCSNTLAIFPSEPYMLFDIFASALSVTCDYNLSSLDSINL